MKIRHQSEKLKESYFLSEKMKKELVNLYVFNGVLSISQISYNSLNFILRSFKFVKLSIIWITFMSSSFFIIFFFK